MPVAVLCVNVCTHLSKCPDERVSILPIACPAPSAFHPPLAVCARLCWLAARAPGRRLLLGGESEVSKYQVSCQQHSASTRILLVVLLGIPNEITAPPSRANTRRPTEQPQHTKGARRSERKGAHAFGKQPPRAKKKKEQVCVIGSWAMLQGARELDCCLCLAWLAHFVRLAVVWNGNRSVGVDRERERESSESIDRSID
jgi:hypothetical protein